ncbi:MAG: pilus assembly protein N-terminal domain-containing protein [Archangium sp.]
MTEHPSDDRLSALAAGTLSSTEVEAIEKHLDGCPTCRQLVAVVSNGSAPTSKHEFGVLRAGERLGRYEIERLIGAGGMGLLYVARDPQLNRRVALKLMRPAFAAEGGSVRLRREAQSMATLAHPNVVNVFDIGETDGRVFMAMELLEGGTLRDWMKEPHSWKELVAIFCDAGEGLAAAHAAGVVHRDFKPENVLIGKDGRPRVGDFGLARPEIVAEEELPRALALAPQHAAMRVTHTGTILGTPAYMSPEQLKGKPADARSDQYGFCVCLYEALAGHRPFPADTLEELRARVEGGMPPPPRDGLIPAHVWAAIARGLNPRPEERFPDMHALLQMLRLDAPKAIAPASRSGGRFQKKELTVSMAVLATALLGAGVFLQSSHRSADVGDVDPIGNSGTISLAVGARKAINAPNLSSVSVDHEHIVKVEKAGPSETLLILEGREPGTATLTITNTSGSTYEHQVRVDAAGAQPSTIAATTSLEVGQQKAFVVPGLERVAVGDPAIANVQTFEDQVVVIGASEGTTKLLVWSRGGKVESTNVEVGHTAAEPEATEIAVAVGEKTTIELAGIKRVAVGDPAVVDVKTMDDKQVSLRGLKAGRTTLLVWTTDGSRRAFELRVAGDAAETGTVTNLSVGQQRVFDFPGLQRVAIGEPSIADVKVLEGGQVLVIGNAPGKTTLLAWTADGQRHTVELQVDPDGIEIRSAVMSVGATTTMDFKRITGIKNRSPDVAKLTHDGKTLTIVALKPGRTNAEVYDGDSTEDVKIVVEKPVTTTEVPDRITLRTNDLAEFHVAGLTRVAIGDPAVADVRISGEERIRVSGVGKGKTTMLAWMKDGSRRSWMIEIK